MNSNNHRLLTFLVDSNPANGASNVSSLGSKFTVNLQSALVIPKNAFNCNVVVKNAIIWFVNPNITKGINSKFKITYNGTTYIFDIPTGLYDVDSLNNKILTELSIASGGSVPNDLIQLLPDIAENKVIIQFNYYNTDIDFTISGGLRDLLGFDSKLIVGYTNPPGSDPLPFYEQADNVAKFNNTDYYLIKCSNLLTRGLERNSQYLGIMARVDVDVPVNSKINYDPRQVPIIPAPELAGIDLSSLTFELTNQDDELVNTRGERWSMVFEIHYDLPDMS